MSECINNVLKERKAALKKLIKRPHEGVGFWIEIKDKFIHIRYFMVRNKGGDDLGTLEMTRNIAPLRTLPGEKRLIGDD